MATESGVAPLDSLKCTPSSLPDLRGADVATTSEGDCSGSASDRSAARTLSRNSSADGGALVADDGTRVTDALLLTTPLTGSGGATTDTAGPIDETDQLLPSSGDLATASQPMAQHSAQMITAALVRQASIDNAKQRAASVNRDGLAGTSLHAAATTCSSDDDDSDEEKNAVANTADGSSCRWWCGRQGDRLKGYVLLLGGMLLAATVYIRLMQEDLECLDVPIWRWTCLGSVTFLGHALSRIFYWMVKSVLSRQNVRLFAYYTLASEVRTAGLLWFRICIQGSAIAILLRDYPEDSERWNLAYVWIVRIMSWLLMLQTCRVMERVFVRCGFSLLLACLRRGNPLPRVDCIGFGKTQCKFWL